MGTTIIRSGTHVIDNAAMPLLLQWVHSEASIVASPDVVGGVICFVRWWHLLCCYCCSCWLSCFALVSVLLCPLGSLKICSSWVPLPSLPFLFPSFFPCYYYFLVSLQTVCCAGVHEFCPRINCGWHRHLAVFAMLSLSCSL